ncbi:hybrid sensor histidine kinase/response regulator [Pseudomonas gingeri]|uniref:histidine kinase n=2 Tax=Pseudomonas gingeri TaxID=117681 RepID=A0A7Y7XUK0_9PSED|nr:PAS domain-containing sensor histidine kinase [Pseudomonas gingeri]NWA03388.1 PAS domain S-box protein [Pseudomonas gingeri]NWA14245.1 PAS domain S-box protein [Pseudomonas gingeri]NWA55137.1 PAS domain S-box protein [Pseudomonas gingeri]NWA94861.1 PAS domain S-box protein [Pseudomonas gingeri]NWB01517.1 PAS domain S-box protein [Pseudomonas gingeri]
MEVSGSRTFEQLAEREAHYRTMFEAVDTGFCTIEMKFDAAGNALDYRFIDMNPAFERETGLVGAQGRWVRDLIPGHEQHWFDIYGEVALTGVPQRFENQAQALGRWYAVHAFRVGSMGEHKVAVFFNDITERRQAETALKQLNASLEQEVASRTDDRNQLWTLSSDIMLRCSFDGQIIAINPAWTDTLGWNESDLLGSSLYDLIHPDDLERTVEGVRQSASGHSLLRFENRYRCKNGGYRWINWSSSPSDQVIHAVGRDCTLDKEQALALAKAEAQLRQSQKMEAVGQLTGGLAHDFNNLLTGISGSLEMLQTRIDQGRVNNLERYINAALIAARRATALTHRLLAFSRRQTLDSRATHINRLITGMEDLIRRTVGPSIQLEAKLSDRLWTTLVDQNQLENSLLNLCINARDAMPDGGRLVIETANINLTSASALALELPPGGYVHLSVADSGSGMSADVLSKAFDPFFTTKPLGSGTGLGLSMVYGFALQSGGQVRINSQPGAGTQVRLYLPRHFAEADEPGVRHSPPPSLQATAGETVLVVDDEPQVRMLEVELLEERGYKVLEASDGVAGLKILQSPIRIDLLVSDVGLPGGMNGRQLAELARRTRPGLKVLFVTGYAESSVIGNGDLAPGMQVMAKPFALDDLANRVRELISNL